MWFFQVIKKYESRYNSLPFHAHTQGSVLVSNSMLSTQTFWELFSVVNLLGTENMILQICDYKVFSCIYMLKY